MIEREFVLRMESSTVIQFVLKPFVFHRIVIFFSFKFRFTVSQCFKYARGHNIKLDNILYVLTLNLN